MKRTLRELQSISASLFDIAATLRLIEQRGRHGDVITKSHPIHEAHAIYEPACAECSTVQRTWDGAK